MQNFKSNSEQYKREIVQVISKVAKDEQLLADFIKELLTPHEFDNIGVRWQIVKRLSKGEHHQIIAENLHVGIATVTRGSREMRKKNGGLQRALKVIHR